MKRLLICSLILLMIASVKAQDFSISIDAERDAFYDGLTNPDDGKIFLPAKAFLSQVNANGPSGDADLSGIVWTAWDEEYIYYYAEVKDEQSFATMMHLPALTGQMIKLK